MAKTPKFAYHSTPRGWCINVPAAVSETGKRERQYFPSRDKAKGAAAALREKFLEHGGNSSAIKPGLAADATKAAAMLDDYKVTLTQAARFYVTHHDKRAKAPTLAEAWTEGLEHRKNHRARTRADFKAWEKALPDSFMKMNCHDITEKDISKALNKVTKGTTRWKNGLRYVSAILGDVVKAGGIDKNPAAKVRVPRAVETDDEVTIYTPAELKALFAACIDYPKPEADRLCAGCVLPFAVMAFAGIRPDEVGRLKWDDISMELKNIRVGSSVAKKAARRNVRINATLAAWIETIPEAKRKGKIIPARWRYKAAKVRTKAGIDGREKQDALRHSFGTYTLATENDLDALKADMGHEHVRVFFTHYHKAMTKADALPYWQVLPAGVELPTIEAVA